MNFLGMLSRQTSAAVPLRVSRTMSKSYVVVQENGTCFGPFKTISEAHNNRMYASDFVLAFENGVRRPIEPQDGADEPRRDR